MSFIIYLKFLMCVVFKKKVFDVCLWVFFFMFSTCDVVKQKEKNAVCYVLCESFFTHKCYDSSVSVFY